MTDPTGRSFLSYRRSHSYEAAMLVVAQRIDEIHAFLESEGLAGQSIAHRPNLTSAAASELQKRLVAMRKLHHSTVSITSACSPDFGALLLDPSP